jgi:hypothetical protein
MSLKDSVLCQQYDRQSYSFSQSQELLKSFVSTRSNIRSSTEEVQSIAQITDDYYTNKTLAGRYEISTYMLQY